MTARVLQRFLMIIVLASAGLCVTAQNTVPLGIHYQAVARDNYGNELVNKKISVKFSVIAGDPLSSPVFQEVHQDVVTSRFGVFSLIIGHGTPTGSASCVNLAQIAWDKADHYLKVEVKFDNDFMDMGTMQFLAVPYALYAQKSLEPGPEGPKGDKGEKGEPGDPASDNQTLSFDGSNLTISGTNSTVAMTPLLQNLQVSNDGTGGYNLSLSRGNTINLATIEKDGDPQNEIQDLLYNSATRELSLLKSTAPAINLTELKNDADADPANEIQDLRLEGNNLKITGNAAASSINLQPYLDNTDSQTLNLAPATNILSISGGNSVNLTDYKDNTDSQQLTYTESNNSLSISGGNSVSLGSMLAFRAKNVTPDASEIAKYTILTYDEVPYNTVGTYFNPTSGIFTAPFDGIYTFNVSYFADGSGDGREVAVYVNGALYEKLAISIGAGSTVTVKSVTMRLNSGNTVNVEIYTGLATQTGTGTFSGFKVY